MPDRESNVNIIRTKLFRPRVASDLVVRSRLFSKLDKGSKCHLTLVSAPAGYGKSMLVSSWLEQCHHPNAWLSLDDEIKDLTTFLYYFLSAIRGVLPVVCPNTLALLDSPDLPSPKMLSAEIINELSEIKTSFVLVLDDYGFIHDPEIHELLNEVIKYSPPTLQIVVLTRHDPPFPLHSFRACGDLVEIRQVDLQFTLQETEAFFDKAIELPLDENALIYLYEKIEGWPVGLRLVALSMYNLDDVNSFLREMRGEARHVQDYLVSEVLSRQSPTMRDGLLKTSILNRFCAPLCKTVCHPDCKDMCGPECDGQVFMNRLEESNLFCIALDEHHEWLRYHHLFRQFLLRMLENRYSVDEITILHDRASTWFEENGMIAEAFHHATKSNAPEAAGELVARHRHEMMNNEQWYRLGYLMDQLPRTSIENNPALLIQDAWVLWNRMRIVEMVKVLNQVESLLGSMSEKTVTLREVQGEVDTLRSLQYYLLPPCDGSRALAYAKRAMQGNPPHHSSTRGMAIILLAVSYQLNGNLKDAFRVVFEGLQQKEAQHNTYHTRLLITLCFLYWLEGDLGNLKQIGEQVLQLGKELQLDESSGIGKHYLGLFHYCQNDLAKVDKYLRGVVKRKNKVNIYNFAHSAFVLSLSNQAQGRSAEASEIVEIVVRYALDTNNTQLLQLTHAFQAELALRQGHLAEAVNWSKNYAPEPFGTAHRFYVPQLTLARILLAQNTPDSREKATDLLSRLHDFYVSIHNKYCLMNVLAMQALLYEALGNPSTADEKLSESIALAEIGRYIRFFVDLGPDMGRLMERQEKAEGSLDYIQELREAFDKDGSDPGNATETTLASDIAQEAARFLKNPLTNRELEIIEMLAQRMSNQEIADNLYISNNTVKRHAANIYRKLEAKNRRAAVEKAYSFGFIT